MFFRLCLSMLLLTTMILLSGSPVVSEEWIVYSSNEGGTQNFWMMHPDGSEKTAITDDNIIVSGWPGSSPDGHQVSYVNAAGDLCTLEIGSPSTPEILLPGTAHSGTSWSPGGRYIYYAHASSGDNDAYRYDLITGTAEFLYDGPEIWPGKHNVGTISERSPAGSLYAVHAQDGSWAPTTEIFIFDPALTNVIRVTDDENNDNQPIWSPDGTSLVWQTVNDWAEPGDDFRAIRLCDPDGNNVHDVFHFEGNVTVRLGGWSPDGQWILFASDISGNWELYRLNPDGLNDYENVSNTPDIDESQSIWVMMENLDLGFDISPASGVLPFESTFWVSLSHHHEGLTRKLAARIEVNTAGGHFYSNWRSGHTNVSSGEAYTVSWPQQLPLLGTLVGENVFRLITEDVTPSPYNQTPYPSSGDTDTRSFVLNTQLP